MIYKNYKEEDEMRSIVLNNKIIEYHVNYNSKKNVNIRIKSDITLNISAPRWVVKSELERILTKKSGWILDNLEKQRKIQRNKKVNVLENNHSIWFQGEKYRLFYRKSDKNYVCITDEQQIIVFSKKSEELEYSQKIFNNWLRELAKVEFTKSLNKYYNRMVKKYKIPEFSLQVRAMKTRWGTCTPGKKKITLNLNLMYAPKEYMEYVALHELTHFIEIYHNEHFYNILTEFMPDWRVRQETLNKEYSQIVRSELN